MNTAVNIYAGTVTGSVFGGGLGDLAALGEGHADDVAKNFGPVTVTVEGGTVSMAVYGGANVNGVLERSDTVTITGGTIGTSGGDVKNAVFGGGYGEPTLVKGDVKVYIGTKSDDPTPVYTGTATIHGNVYGGGALGNTNVDTSGNPTADANTDVYLYAGTINGNVFGGALGQKAVAQVLYTAEDAEVIAGTKNVGDVKTAAVSAVAAIVGGDVNVLLDGAKLTSTYTGTGENRVPVTGQIFGANNMNGTPKGHVTVHVKRTVNVDSEEDALKSNSSTPRDSRTTYDVAAVYGGGNQADYVPTDATLTLDSSDPEYDAGNPDKVDAAKTKVIIEGCEKTSIDHVYGGGNAAAVPATEVTIFGSYIINTVYGGGNGKSTATFTNPGADVGIIDPVAYAADNTTGIYGTGKAVTKLYGGYINDVYGGSNTKGDVRGGTDVSTKGKTEAYPPGYDCCTKLNVGNVYGAGSHADVAGDVNITLECMPEDYVDAVYGGAELATVDGNVTLTVTSGKFGRVFGGNNAGGDIRGSITVNVYEDGCQPLRIGELYGGGNEAPYSIFGCTDDNGTWTAEENGTPYYGGEPDGRTNVKVNVFACTSIGKVFGGGNQAPVIGNTHVYINTIKGRVNGTPQLEIGKIAQVFGGGNEAKVKGNTRVDIGTATASEAIGVKITKGTYTDSSNGTYISPTDNEYIDMPSAGIYGGGNAADVEGNTELNIGTVSQSLGTTIAGNIFGGGFGETTTVTGDVVVNIGKRTNTAGEGEPAVYTYEGYANITGDVYGGSAKGKVNATKGTDPAFSATANKSTHVNLYGGTINGNLYGGGLGESTHAADV